MKVKYPNEHANLTTMDILRFLANMEENRECSELFLTNLLVIARVANRPLAFATPAESQESCDAWQMLRNMILGVRGALSKWEVYLLCQQPIGDHAHEQ